MSNGQRGILVLKEVPGGEAAKKVVVFLSTILKATTNDYLKEKVKNTPFILNKDMPAEKAQIIVEALQKLGATVTFVPHTSIRKPHAEEITTFKTPTRNAPEFSPFMAEELLPIKPELRESGTRRKITILMTMLLFLTLGFFAWQVYPLVADKLSIMGSGQQKVLFSSEDRVGFHSIHERVPSIIAVEPKEMYPTFLRQYQLRPDIRFIKAFKILTQRFEDYHDKPLKQSSFEIGEVLSNGKEIRIPLLKKKRKIAEFTISLPMTFPETMSALNQCLNVMSEGKTKTQILSLNKDDLIIHNNAKANINKVDPRSILSGLMQLEGLWQKSGPHSQILLTAVRAYTMLLMVLFPDRMDYTDDFAAHALVYLAIAKQMEPDITHINEEALLAMVMDYTAHAKGLLETDSSGAFDFSNKIIEAYVRQDLQTLKELQARTPEIIGAYLLTRLYRELGLKSEAEKITKHILEWYPGHYPMIVEAIYSANLVTAKRLTVLYPLDILALLEEQITPGSLSDTKNWQERFKGIYGDQSTADISITQYDNLLDKWIALEFKTNQGFLIDGSHIKTTFRTLYTGALFLRFIILMDRWGKVDKAENFAQMLAIKDKDHPLVMEMLADVNAERGKRKEADKICTRLINHPQVSGRLVFNTIFNLEDPLNQIRLTAIAAQKIDGRPDYMFFKGRILQKHLYYDLAEKYYRLGLKQNPYYYYWYTNLSHVTRSDEPLASAIKKYPFSFTLLEKAGDYFAEQIDHNSKEKAIECYTQAIKLVPNRRSLPRKKARVLRQLDRHEEAVDILQTWLKENDTKDMTMVYYRSALANNFLKMKKPQLAMEVIRDDIDSYQSGAMMVGARAYEDTGQVREAEGIYLKAVKRYPTLAHVLSDTAAFFWRQSRSQEAAEFIAKGRKSMWRFSPWYFKDFIESLASAPEEEILEAVDFLIKNGATNWEVSSLGYRLQQNQRPEVGFKIIQKIKVQGTMLRLEKIIDLYKILKEWRGEEEALDYMRKAVPPNLRAPLAMVLYKEGLFDLILTEIDDSIKLKPAYKEFFWLQRLIAWLALEKKPTDLDRKFIDHYDPSWLNKIKLKVFGKNSHDHYYDIGRYLFEMMSYEELLNCVKTPKQRCEIAYYIGLGERLKSNFPEAANWYHLCRETLLINNGEYHWANDELFWWGHMGTQKRHRLLRDDIKAYHTKRLRHTGS